MFQFVASSKKCRVAFSAVIFLGISFTDRAYADNTENAYNAFLIALSALTASSSSVIQNGRNAGRLDEIRKSLTAKLAAGLTGKPFPTPSPPPAGQQPQPVPPKNFSLADLDESHLLCDLRAQTVEIVPKGQLSGRDAKASITVDQIELVAAQNYLNTVLTQLKGITPPNATDIPSALRELFTSYQVKAPVGGVQPKEIATARGAVLKSSNADLGEYDAAYYGYKIQLAPPTPAAAAASAAITSGLPSLSFLGPWGAAFDTITNIFAPVVVGLSNIVANYQQQAAIQQYLAAEKQELKGQGDALGRTESDFLFAERLSLAGTFAEQIAVIKSVTIDLTKIDECKAPLTDLEKRSADEAGVFMPSAAFRLCYRAVWSKFQSAVDDALKTATAYDQIADAGDTSTALNAYANLTGRHYDTILNSQITNATDFWKSVNDLITFAGAVSNATSGKNLEDLKKAVDSLK
jgi:hypothetical protein